MSACSEDVFVEVLAHYRSVTIEQAWKGNILGSGDLALLVLERVLWGPVLAALPQPPPTSLVDKAKLLFIGYSTTEVSNPDLSVLKILELQYLSQRDCYRALAGT
eukprot:CAMPEP_0177597738 /NCGR_PEP_ID=MMETSP0419_2-20121207/11890_1 /TAXON_ID=582737 /ORGANISM="Tetraselmis sp., Strain GSL018" /LENGTH=104 /DNA_ID=CAMNT_0019089965 /DNA_START=609 /DNA_END=920 /DNA_ORIENTATION=+